MQARVPEKGVVGCSRIDFVGSPAKIWRLRAGNLAIVALPRVIDGKPFETTLITHLGCKVTTQHINTIFLFFYFSNSIYYFYF